MIDQLLRALGDLGLRPTGEEIADALWLASHTGVQAAPASPAAGAAVPVRVPPSATASRS